MSDLYVPKEGERFRVVEPHPTPSWCSLKVGEELVQGTDCRAYGSRDALWLTVKRAGKVDMCRAEPAGVPADKVDLPEKFVVHTVEGYLLERYLNGEEVSLKSGPPVSGRRQKLVNIFQEAHPDQLYGGTLYNYRVVWERL